MKNYKSLMTEKSGRLTVKAPEAEPKTKKSQLESAKAQRGRSMITTKHGVHAMTIKAGTTKTNTDARVQIKAGMTHGTQIHGTQTHGKTGAPNIKGTTLGPKTQFAGTTMQGTNNGKPSKQEQEGQ